MTHYICTGGCQGESQEKGTCQADGCAKHGQPLTPCHCEDGEHSGVLKEDDDQQEETSDV